MKKRSKFFILAAAFVIIAVAASIFLIPGTQERALTSYRDKEYSTALALYEEEYKAGRITLDTVMHLTGVYLQYAEVDKAIEVMEAFVERNPNHLQARQELGRLYQYGQRPEEYLKNLEIINQLAASSQTSSELATAYKVTQATEKNIPLMINRLMAEEQGTAQEFRDLVRLLAAGQRFQEAVDISVEFRKRFPNEMEYSDHELAMRLYADMSKQQELVDYALSLQPLSLNSSEIARTTDILLYRVNAQAAFDYLEHYEDMIASDNVLFEKYITVLENVGRQKEAYALLLARYEEGTLPTPLHDELMITASRYGNEEVMNSLRNSVDYDSLEESEIISLIELSLTRKDDDLLKRINVRAGRLAAEKQDFYLQAILMVANNETGKSQEIVRVMSEEPSFTRRMQLALLCAPRGFGECIDGFYNTLPPLDSLNDTEVVTIAQILQQTKRRQEAYEFLTQVRESREGALIHDAWFPLAAMYEQESVIRAELESREDISEEALKDGFFLAMDNGKHDTAILIAETMLARQENADTRGYVTQAYLKAGRYEEALPALREMRDDSERAEADYLFVLSKLARKQDEYATELTEYSLKVLDGGVSAKRRQAIIYAMTEAGQQGRIMPYVRDLALANPREWAFLYVEHVKQSGGNEAVAGFWKEVLARHPKDTELRSQIAYAMLESGQRDLAIELFSDLAVTESPDSPLVSQLLYIWGPLYPDEGINWVSARADAAASPQEKLRWLQLLAGGVTDEQLLDVAHRQPDLLAIPSVEQRYLEALSARVAPKDMPETMQSYLSPRIEASGNVAELLRYADLAGAYGLGVLETSAYDKVLEISPDNPIALAKSGVAAYGVADYSQSTDRLSRYFAKGTPELPATAEAYRPVFYYAELLRRDKKPEQAEPYYRQVVAAASAASEEDVEFHSMAARSMIYGGFEEKGLEIFQTLLKKYPDNRQIKADYTTTLVELKQRDQAKQSLQAWATPVQAQPENMMPLSLSELNASSYKLVDNNRRILLTHADASHPVPLATIERTPWIGYGIEGRGETMLVAESGYSLQVMPASDNTIWLHPVKTPNLSTQRLDESFAVQNELVAARLEVETGDGYESSKRMQKLTRQYPENPQVLGFAANVENFIGNPHYARKLINKAHTLQPQNEDIIALQRGIERVNASSIYLDGEWRALDDNDEFITTVGGTYDVNEDVQVGIEVQNDAIDSTTLRLPDGQQDQFEVDRQRGELFVRLFRDEGSTSQVSLFANNDTAGVGAYHQFVNRFGLTNLGVELRRPYWELVEGVIDDATRDRVEIGHRYSPDNLHILTGEIGLNNYNTAYKSNISSSVTVNGSIARQVNETPYLAVGYGLDAEYEIDEKNGRDANGIPFQRFPLDSREVHSANVFGNYDFSMDTNAEGIVSYGFDRISGDSGPAVEGRVTHYLNDELSVQGRAGYGFRGGADDGDVTRAGVRLQYRY